MKCIFSWCLNKQRRSTTGTTVSFPVAFKSVMTADQGSNTSLLPLVHSGKCSIPEIQLNEHVISVSAIFFLIICNDSTHPPSD